MSLSVNTLIRVHAAPDSNLLREEERSMLVMSACQILNHSSGEKTREETEETIS